MARYLCIKLHCVLNCVLTQSVLRLIALFYNDNPLTYRHSTHCFAHYSCQVSFFYGLYHRYNGQYQKNYSKGMQNGSQSRQAVVIVVILRRVSLPLPEASGGSGKTLAAGCAQLRSAAMASLVGNGNSETLYAGTARELSYG
jgi:hypothetical protein